MYTEIPSFYKPGIISVLDTYKQSESLDDLTQFNLDLKSQILEDCLNIKLIDEVLSFVKDVSNVFYSYGAQLNVVYRDVDSWVNAINETEGTSNKQAYIVQLISDLTEQ